MSLGRFQNCNQSGMNDFCRHGVEDEFEAYSGLEAIARERLARRDEDDWPILAAALALRCPIWTEDTDFFGCGVATWTSDRVEMYLSDVAP